MHEICKLKENIRIQEIVNTEIIPLEPAFLQSSSLKDISSEIDKVRSDIKRQGLWAPFLDKERGGMGLSLRDFAETSEILGQSPLGHYAFGCQAPDLGNIELLIKFATPAQKAKYLAPLIAGEVRSCFAMTEKENSGANPLFLEAKAEKVGPYYKINGNKWFTTGADGAAFCLAMLASENTDNPRNNASIVIIPTESPGFHIRRNISVMGHPGAGPFSHSEIEFKDCMVPEENLLSTPGSGYQLAQDRLGPGRIHHCMRWIGIAKRAWKMMCQRAINRKISTKGFLGESSLIQTWISECAADIQAARLMVHNAIEVLESQDKKQARAQISMIKFFVANILQNVLDKSLQVHGSLGMSDDTILAYFYREERAARIYDGPDEVHKISLAQRLMRPFKDEE